MKAIATIESGRSFDGTLHPWPWAVQAEGQSLWFADATDAERQVVNLVRQGINNVDVGCFQLNIRWHGGGFQTVAAMFAPDSNARYAAAFLRQLFLELGTWEDAAAAYHSRTPEHSARYLERLRPVLARFNGTLEATPDPSDPAPPLPTPPPEAKSPFAPDGSRALASLVPLGPGGFPLFEQHR